MRVLGAAVALIKAMTDASPVTSPELTVYATRRFTIEFVRLIPDRSFRNNSISTAARSISVKTVMQFIASSVRTTL